MKPPPRPRRSGLPLAAEIVLALCVKLVLLALLWHFLFASPQAPQMRMPETQVARHLLDDGLTPPTFPSTSAPEAPHDSAR